MYPDKTLPDTENEKLRRARQEAVKLFHYFTINNYNMCVAKQTIIILISLLCVALGSGGCAVLSHKEQLLTLKAAARSADEITHYLNRQEDNFNAILDDFKHDRIENGITTEEIRTRYGEPVLITEVQENQRVKTVFLYRHPTQFFASDRLYLYFDEYEQLVRLEYKPAQ